VNVPNSRLAQHDLSRIGLFPLPNVVLFPAQSLSLHVFEPRYRRLVSDVIEHHSLLAIPRLKPGFDAEYYGAPPVFQTCGVGQVSEYTRLPDGRFNIVVQGLSRVRLLEELRSEPYRVARAEAAEDVDPPGRVVAESLRTELLKLLRRAAPHLLGPAKDLESRVRAASDAAESADIVAGTLVEDPDERQALLEELDPCRRLTWLVAHVHGLGVRLAGGSALTSERWN
jgi:Lon protease-like protein